MKPTKNINIRHLIQRPTQRRDHRICAQPNSGHICCRINDVWISPHDSHFPELSRILEKRGVRNFGRGAGALRIGAIRKAKWRDGEQTAAWVAAFCLASWAWYCLSQPLDNNHPKMRSERGKGHLDAHNSLKKRPPQFRQRYGRRISNSPIHSSSRDREGCTDAETHCGQRIMGVIALS